LTWTVFAGFPLFQKYAAQSSQVVQDSAASGHVVTQLCKGVGDKLEGLLLPFRAAVSPLCKVRIHVASGFRNRFDQQFHKLLRAFDVVKWSLRLEAQMRSSRAIQGMALSDQSILTIVYQKNQEFVKLPGHPVRTGQTRRGFQGTHWREGMRANEISF
jgi:hypothetical protein